MKKTKLNPYKYLSIVLATLTLILFSFSSDVTIPYCIITGALIIYLGTKIIAKPSNQKNVYVYIGYFCIYIVLSMLTLGPILYLVIPHFADKYVLTMITVVNNDKVNNKRSFIWNSPIEGTKLSVEENYLYNASSTAIYLISAPYVYENSRIPYLGNGLQLKEIIEPNEMIKNRYEIYYYLQIPPDVIEVKVGKFGRNFPSKKNQSTNIFSSHTYFFIVTQEQYRQLSGYDASVFY